MPTPNATARSFRVALEGFSKTERELLSSHLCFLDEHGPAYQLVSEPSQSDLLVVDADQPELAQRVVASWRLVDTVFVGKQAPPHALACVTRPIDPTQVRRELDRLIAQRTVRVGLDVELPLRADAAAPPSVDLLLHDLALPDAIGHGGGRAVLVVDDSPIARKFLTARLQHLGYAVQVAPDGEQALAIATREHIAVVFLDVDLGRSAVPDGLQVCQQLRQQATERRLAPPAVVLVADGDASPTERVRASLIGCAGYLTKPLLEPEFIEALRTADPQFRTRDVAPAT